MHPNGKTCLQAHFPQFRSAPLRQTKPREVTAQRPFETRCGAFFRAQFSGSRAARKETDTDLCVLTRRSAALRALPRRLMRCGWESPSMALTPRRRCAPMRRSKGGSRTLIRRFGNPRSTLHSALFDVYRIADLRTLPRRLMRCGWESPTMALTPRRRCAPMRRSKGGSRTLIRRFGSPRSTFHSALFDVYRIADLRAHFKASVSRPAKTASCRLKKTRRRARSVPRPRQGVLKGGSSAGPRAPLSPLHFPNVLDNAV